MFTDKASTTDLAEYLALCHKFADIDTEVASAEIRAAIRQHDKKSFLAADMKNMLRLEKMWNASLKTDSPAYSVYSDPYYFCEAWLCWVKYSRRYLRDISSPKSLHGKSVIASMQRVKSVLDLGCGAGYTTASLKELFPRASVCGTNVPGSCQFKMSSFLGKRHDFKIVKSHKRVVADLIFASEYFEHFPDPVDHLIDVIETTNFKYILFANTFSSPAIGHFSDYDVNGSKMTGRKVGRVFRQTLRDYGYEKVKTALWNDRPSFWRRSK